MTSLFRVTLWSGRFGRFGASSFLDEKSFLHVVTQSWWRHSMSTSDEEPYSTIFASLKHPIRRRILRMLSKRPMSFMEMVEVLGVSNSFLTYHLDNLGELIGKTQDGKYKLSSFGEAANATMTKVEDIPTIAPDHTSKMKRNGFRGRSVAMALGIVCILLIASLSGTILYYTMAINNEQSELSSANKTINQLNATILKQDDAINQLNTTVTSLQNQTASDNATITSLEARVIIDGITYSRLPTPYGRIIINYYTLLPKEQSDPTMDFGMLWHTATCYLLVPFGPTPPASPDLLVDNGSSPISLWWPDPAGQVMINGWLYSQIPTNLTEFTMPQFTSRTFWTFFANEPIPTDAQILNSTA